MKQFVYLVDAEDRITFVDENWLAFAGENGPPKLTAETVIGQPLWNFVSEITTRHIYQLLMGRVRTSGLPVCIPFRCDSPDRRRFMELQINPLPAGALELRSRLFREEERRYVALLDAAIPRSKQMVSMCAWCKKVKVADWVEVEAAVHELGMFAERSVPLISHVTCPACEKLVLAQFGV